MSVCAHALIGPRRHVTLVFSQSVLHPSVMAAIVVN